jgi:hypothetical protein
MAVDATDEALFSAATLVRVHNGKTVRFWTSSRLSGVSPAAMFPRLYNRSRNKRQSVRDALQNDNWVRDIIHDITTSEIADYVMLWEIVTETGFDVEDQAEDEIVGTRSPNGIYTAKSAYELQFEGNIIVGL